MNKPLSGRRILVVEDEIHLRMTMEDVLVDLGCESVTTTATTEKAVALVEAQVFDAAVLDMNLNGDSSRLVADALAKCGVPFIFATGNRGEMWTDFATAPVLRKPFKHAELVEILTRLLPR